MPTSISEQIRQNLPMPKLPDIRYYLSYNYAYRAKRARKALGGGMRQAGVLAATAMYAILNTMYNYRAKRARKALGGGMRQAGVLAAAAMYAILTTIYNYRAKRARKALGGGMRQAGVLAAAAMYALDTVFPRLQVDHNHATEIVQGKCILKLMVTSPDMHVLHFCKSSQNFKQDTRGVTIRKKRIAIYCDIFSLYCNILRYIIFLIFSIKTK